MIRIERKNVKNSSIIIIFWKVMEEKLTEWDWNYELSKVEISSIWPPYHNANIFSFIVFDCDWSVRYFS